jgi:hypothetical protein
VLFHSYSERTACPACKAKIRMEDVKLTPAFSCPHCSASIAASDGYHRMVKSITALSALVIVYVLGFKLWVAMLLWYPVMFLLVCVWAYVVKYWIPPTLVRSVAKDSSALGLKI